MKTFFEGVTRRYKTGGTAALDFTEAARVIDTYAVAAP
jgi:hypothetical protein